MTTAPLGAFFFLGTLMAETYVCFIDVGYLRAEGAKALGARARNVRPDAEKVAEWARNLRGLKAVDAQFLRAYWYDGAFDPSHPEYAGQRRFFNAIAQTPGIQLRLGHIAERQHRLRNPIRSALRNSPQLWQPPLWVWNLISYLKSLIETGRSTRSVNRKVLTHS